MSEPKAVLASATRALPALEFTVNFGVFSGREVSAHELDRLGEALLRYVETASITAENRREVGPNATGSIHQVRVEIDNDAIRSETQVEALRQRLAEAMKYWLASCISGISGRELDDAELEARDAVVEVVYGDLHPRRLEVD